MGGWVETNLVYSSGPSFELELELELELQLELDLT